MFAGLVSALLVAGSLLSAMAALPSTTNYKLNSYGFGSGGTANSGTANYSLEGISGELSGQSAATSAFQTQPGFIQTQTANAPKVTLTNPSNYYDKLHFAIDTQNNPTDALYALQVCVGGDFPCASPLYVKSDDTLGSTLTITDYQTYAAWGSGGGANIIGLAPGTTYYVRATATQGSKTQSAYGPSATAATVSQQISFCLYTTSCGSANSTSFGGLLAGAAAASSPNLQLILATNADNGGNVYIYSKNSALQSSSHPSGTINSSPGTTDLSAVSQGYGAQVSSSTSLTAQSPYNGSGNNVGGLTTTANTILSAAGPVTGGAATIQLQAKAANTTPAASDYSDVITVIAAANF